MILPDHMIRDYMESNDLYIYPFDEEMLQPASLDIRLSNKFLVFRNHVDSVIDVKKPTGHLTEPIEADEFYLHPGEFVLGSTVEWFSIPNTLVARVEGKSSLGRLGLLIHSTAGFVDPGFKGNITLELCNISNMPIVLYSDMKIGQVSFMQLAAPVENPYGTRNNKYQKQNGPTASKYHDNFTQET